MVTTYRKRGELRVKWGKITTAFFPVRHYNTKSQAESALHSLKKVSKAKLDIVNDDGLYAIVSKTRATLKSSMRKLKKIRPQDFKY